MAPQIASSASNSSPSMATSSSNTSPSSPPVTEQSWQTLIDNVLAFIDSHPRPYPYKRMEKPFVPGDYATRDSPLEVCAIEICQAHSEYMVIGTYSLIDKDDKREHEAQMRKGTLSILTVAAKFHATYPGMLPPTMDKHDFASAILDIHFHPVDDSLLCVATSAASIHFFRLVKHASILDRRIEMKLLPLGWAKIAEDDDHGLTHLITQFAWLPEITTTGKEGINDQLVVTLAATESSGRAQLVKLAIPAIKTAFDKRADILSQPEKLAFSQVYLQTHSEEAWTVASLNLPSPPGTHSRFLLSGGDDSALKTSLLSLTTDPSSHDILDSPSIAGWSDTKSHAGGVTAILPLPSTLSTRPDSDQPEMTTPFLTGSYDDTLRLYTLHPTTLHRRLILSTGLGGGVWRLKLMDSYFAASAQHFLVLASCMHAGVRILRLCYSAAPSMRSENEGWRVLVVGCFEKGHASMVYGCDFRRDDEHGRYTIVSTSFYDKKICSWGFVDQVKNQMRELSGGQGGEVLEQGQGTSMSGGRTDSKIE